MLLPPLSLRTKFLCGTLTIIFLIGVIMISVIRPVLERQLRGIIARNGQFIASRMAAHSVSPMLTEQYLDLAIMAKDAQRDADAAISYLFFVDRHGTVVSHTFPEGFPVELQDANQLAPGGQFSLRRLLLGDEAVLDIVAPILAGEVGAVHIGLSENMVSQNVGRVIRIVTWILVAVLLIGAALAALFDFWVARPLRNLTVAFTAAGQGRLNQRIPVQAHDEIGQLTQAFNNAVELRRQAEAEREAVIGELNVSLAKVKQLSGMLPICASCKNIRDDQGYWSQIESYITRHSEAEFTHGICPDCAKKLYGQYLKKE
jgi:HAMP domain-containing protein